MVISAQLRTTGNSNEIPERTDREYIVLESSLQLLFHRSYHRLSLRVKLLYFALRGKKRGMMFSAKRFRLRMMKARPCGSQQIDSSFLSSERISIKRCGKIFESPSSSKSLSALRVAPVSCMVTKCFNSSNVM
jgi:hypothetical protein